MSARGCYHLLLVGLQGQRPAAFCTRNLFGRYVCPKVTEENYVECHGHQEGEPLVRLFSNEGAEANAFHPPILQADPDFVEIMIQFMVPDWRKESDALGAQARGAPPSTAASSWFGFRPAPPASPSSPPSPPRRASSRPPFLPKGGRRQEESVLEAGSGQEHAEAEDSCSTIERPPGAGKINRLRGLAGADEPEVVGSSYRPNPQGGEGHVPDQPYRGSAVTRMVRSRHYQGELQLVERRGLLQVEWAADASSRRPPLTLVWHSSYGSGKLLLGPHSASPSFVVYGTQLRMNPQETSLWARHDIVCALDMQHGNLLWRWRNVFLACPPQIVEGVVLLRRLDTLWAVDEATGQRLWDEPVEGEHAEEAGLAEGKAVFHTGRRFRAVDLKTGRTLWEVAASLRSPRPVASGPRILLAAEDHIRAVSASSGTDLWRVTCHGPENRVPAVSDSHVVFWTWDAHLHALRSSTGRREWSLRGRTFYPGDDPVISDGWVFVRDGDLGDSFLVALDEGKGRVRWQVPLEESIAGSLGVQGRQVLLLNAQGEIVSLERDTGALVWKLACPASGLMLVRERLLVWSEGVLYCYALSP